MVGSSRLHGHNRRHSKLNQLKCNYDSEFALKSRGECTDILNLLTQLCRDTLVQFKRTRPPVSCLVSMCWLALPAGVGCTLEIFSVCRHTTHFWQISRKCSYSRQFKKCLWWFICICTLQVVLPANYCQSYFLFRVVFAAAAEKVRKRVLSFEDSNAPSCGRAGSLWCEHWVSSTMMPPCEPPGGCLGFFSTVQGFFHAICAWLLDMAVKQGTEQAWLRYPLSKRSWKFSFWVSRLQVRWWNPTMALLASECRSLPSHGFLFIFIAVHRSHVRRLPRQTMQNCLRDFSADTIAHFNACSMTTHSFHVK